MTSGNYVINLQAYIGTSIKISGTNKEVLFLPQSNAFLATVDFLPKNIESRISTSISFYENTSDPSEKLTYEQYNEKYSFYKNTKLSISQMIDRDVFLAKWKSNHKTNIKTNNLDFAVHEYFESTDEYITHGWTSDKFDPEVGYYHRSNFIKNTLIKEIEKLEFKSSTDRWTGSKTPKGYFIKHGYGNTIEFETFYPNFSHTFNNITNVTGAFGDLLKIKQDDEKTIKTIINTIKGMNVSVCATSAFSIKQKLESIRSDFSLIHPKIKSNSEYQNAKTKISNLIADIENYLQLSGDKTNDDSKGSDSKTV